MAEKNVADYGEIRANRIVLVDGSGKERIVMQLVNDQPSITLIGLNGHVQVSLSIDGGNYDSAELKLISFTGNAMGRFSADDHPTHVGCATLLLAADEHKRIVATTDLSGMLPTLDLIDEAGSTVAHLPASIPKKAENARKKSKSKKALKSKGGKSK